MNDFGDRHIRTDIDMQVVARDLEVHLLFNEQKQDGTPTPAYTSNFILSAADAVIFAGMVADLAYEIDTGLKPVGAGLKAALIERARIKLNARFALMLKKSREDKTMSDQKLAQVLVDTAMHEVYT